MFLLVCENFSFGALHELRFDGLLLRRFGAEEAQGPDEIRALAKKKILPQTFFFDKKLDKRKLENCELEKK